MSGINPQSEPSFSIISQGIRDLSFENILDPTKHGSEHPAIDIGIEASSKKIDNGTFEVSLKINVEAKHDSKPLFLLSLEYIGLCKIENIQEDMISGLLMVQTPSLLFPFARQIIANITSSSGLPPLLLQPVDFAALYHSQQDNNQVAGHA